MKQRYVEVPMSAFDSLLPGKGLTARQFGKIGELKDYDVKGTEHDMYPGLVSLGVNGQLLPAVLNYRTVQTVQRCCGCHSLTRSLQGCRALDGEREHRPSA